MVDHQKAAPLGCRLAPPVPRGTVIQDIRQKKWKVGKPIGSGAFGDIYLARYSEREEEEYVIKVEPHSNGPLFVEIHAFLRLGLEQHRVDWVPRNGKPQGWVGIPNYFGSGSFTIGKEKLRFLVLSRLGSDIQKFFQSGDKPLPLPTALNISVQILESLEYIHSKNYTHNDIKAQNVLLGYGQDRDTVYLVDFGLACKYRDQLGFHRGAEPDERKAHEGTLEYTSRDAHDGMHSRRGDLETLGYNIVHWVTGYLPWINITDPEKVQASKIGFMFNIPGFLEKCFKPNKYPKVLENYLTYVTSLQFDEAPDFSKLRKLLIQSMRSEGVEPYSPLVFSDKTKQAREESSDEEEMVQEETRNTRSQDEEERYSPWSWEQVLAQDPESIIRQASRSSEQDEDLTEKTEAFNRQQLHMLANPTPEMQRIIAAKEEQEKKRQGLSWKEQLQEFNQRKEKEKEKFATMDLEPRENTPAMEEVIQRRAQRLAAGIDTPMTPEPSDDEGEGGPEEGALVNTVVKAGKRRSARSSRSVTPTELTGSMITRSRSTTPTESPSTMFSRMTTRSGRTTPVSRSSSRASTPPFSIEYSTRSRASTPAASSSRASTPDLYATTTRSRSRSASSEYDVTDSSAAVGGVRVTRSRTTADQQQSAADQVTTRSRSERVGSDNSTDFKLPSSIIKVTCSLCGKRMLKDSLERHMDRKHSAAAAAAAEADSTHAVVTSTTSEHASRTSEMLSTRSARVRKLDWNPQPQIEEEPSEMMVTSPEGVNCPMCYVKIPKMKFMQHFDETHSPARKITRKQFQDVRVHSGDNSVLTVHASTDSPCKIFNLSSPIKEDCEEPDSTTSMVDFKKELSF